jgi:SOS-response transcriptional repressor LexA
VSELLAAKGYSLSSACKEMGYSERLFWSCKNRGSYPKYEVAFELAKLLGITMEELLTNEKPLAFTVDDTYMVYKAHDTETVFVPIIIIDSDGKASCMSGKDRTVPIPQTSVMKYSNESLRAMYVSGDEMSQKGIMVDDIIIYNMRKNTGNGVYAIAYKGKLYVRRIDFGTFSTKVTISTAKGELDESVVIEADDPGFVILGKVVLVIHEYE